MCYKRTGMGTSGTYCIKHKGKYYTFYYHYDSNYNCLGVKIVNDIKNSISNGTFEDWKQFVEQLVDTCDAVVEADCDVLCEINDNVEKKFTKENINEKFNNIFKKISQFDKNFLKFSPEKELIIMKYTEDVILYYETITKKKFPQDLRFHMNYKQIDVDDKILMTYEYASRLLDSFCFGSFTNWFNIRFRPIVICDELEQDEFTYVVNFDDRLFEVYNDGYMPFTFDRLPVWNNE